MGSTKTKIYLVIALTITFFTLLPVVRDDFVNWDDNVYVYDNPAIRTLSLAQVKTFFTTFYAANYHPLVYVSYALEYRLFKLNPLPYHVTNLILHLANCALVFWLIYLISRGNPFVAGFTALLFGIHPLHVEAVAWISGRKDVLYAFFYLAAAVVFTKARNLEHRSARLYWLSLFLFLCSLLSKPMAVTLPVLLLLIEWYIGRKPLSGAIVRLTPFLILSMLFGVIASLAQNSFNAFRQDQVLNLTGNLMNAVKGLVFYLVKTVVPAGLSCYYPPLNEIGGSTSYVLAGAIPLLALVVMAVWYSTRYNRKVLFGSMFFLVTLLPVLQLLPISRTAPADRYVYLPLVGIFYIAAEGLDYLLSSPGRSPAALKVIPVIVLLVLSLTSWNRAKIWKDSITLWNNVIQNYGAISTAYLNRGLAYRNRSDYDKALADYDRAIALFKISDDAYNNRANIYFLKKQYDKALENYSLAIKLREKIAIPDRDLATYYNNRAYCYYLLGDRIKALADIESAQALGLKPDPGIIQLFTIGQ